MKTILVVDDEAKIIQITRDYLAHAGFQVTSASDGPAALAAYRSSRPDLIILDWMGWTWPANCANPPTCRSSC
jgi:CheY-like chemotaxis protein